jgi:antitoxin Phd
LIQTQWFLFPKPIRIFSKVARLVDRYGSAVILKNNSPRYLILEFNQADEESAAPNDDVLALSQKLIARNKAVYEELAK